MKEYNGTYRGLTPTDESAIGYGEIEITVTDETIKCRAATGLKVEENEIPTSSMKRLTQEEAASLFNPGTEGSAKVVVFQNLNGPTFFFPKEIKPGEIGGLTVLHGTMSDFFGPAVLFTPEQVRRGEFDKMIAEIEEKKRMVIPRLHLDGKAE